MKKQRENQKCRQSLNRGLDSIIKLDLAQKVKNFDGSNVLKKMSQGGRTITVVPNDSIFRTFYKQVGYR